MSRLTQHSERKLLILQKTNHELAKTNAQLSVQVRILQGQLLECMEDRIRSQEERVSLERQLLSVQSTFEVFRVEMTKRMPVLAAVSDHLKETEELFDQLCQLDCGQVLMTRVKLSIEREQRKERAKIELPPIMEEVEFA